MAADSDAIASPTGMMDVTMGGEWEAFTATEALPAAGPIELIDPQPADFVDLEDIEALAISWQAAPGNQVYVEVDREGAHRTWLTEDDGSIAIPIADLGDVAPGDLADVHVYRRVVSPELDANGNDLTLEAWSVVSFRAGITGDRSCKAILDASPAATSGSAATGSGVLSVVVGVV